MLAFAGIDRCREKNLAAGFIEAAFYREDLNADLADFYRLVLETNRCGDAEEIDAGIEDQTLAGNSAGNVPNSRLILEGTTGIDCARVLRQLLRALQPDLRFPDCKIGGEAVG
jgi:hypothetical protein